MKCNIQVPVDYLHYVDFDNLSPVEVVYHDSVPYAVIDGSSDKTDEHKIFCTSYLNPGPTAEQYIYIEANTAQHWMQGYMFHMLKYANRTVVIDEQIAKLFPNGGMNQLLEILHIMDRFHSKFLLINPTIEDLEFLLTHGSISQHVSAIVINHTWPEMYADFKESFDDVYNLLLRLEEQYAIST